MVNTLRRRDLLLSLAAVGLAPRAAMADTVDLRWTDLMPNGEIHVSPDLLGLIDHEGAPLINQQPPSSGVRHEWSGRNVRLPGFIVPIEHQGTDVVTFILVPYVGACVHIPPPPSNQLVLVTAKEPYESSGLFEPVEVTGLLGIATISTALAEVGYTMSADRVQSYRG